MAENSAVHGAGIFSTGRFIRPYVEGIVAACPDADITLAGVRVAGAEILQRLDAVLEATFQAVVCGAGEIPALVDNLVQPMCGNASASAPQLPVRKEPRGELNLVGK